jgi:hypothetical protein
MEKNAKRKCLVYPAPHVSTTVFVDLEPSVVDEFGTFQYR